jgi:hypothetical protein
MRAPHPAATGPKPTGRPRERARARFGERHVVKTVVDTYRRVAGRKRLTEVTAALDADERQSAALR